MEVKMIARLCELKLQLAIAGLVLAGGVCNAQEMPSASPQPGRRPGVGEQQEPLKVFTEEVLIPVFIRTSNGRFDRTVGIDDLLLFEDDIPQQITSVRLIPSSVLLLLDTSGELNPAMKTTLTRDIAMKLVSSLALDDSVAVVQFGGRSKTLQDWTVDKESVARVLRTKLSSGTPARLADALQAAVQQLRSRPAGSRHVVLVTDGVGAPSDRLRLLAAIAELLCAHATVHVISYTSIGRTSIERRNPAIKVTNEKRKSAQDIANEIMNPSVPWEEINKRKIYVIIDTDIEMRNVRKNYKRATRESEEWLTRLATETGGLMLLPATADEMVKQAAIVAREIDSHYVIAYRPRRLLAAATPGDYRRLSVVSRRGGLEARTRSGYLVPAR
jgi:VWFA-related protein